MTVKDMRQEIRLAKLAQSISHTYWRGARQSKSFIFLVGVHAVTRNSHQQARPEIGNHIGDIGAKFIAQALERNHTITAIGLAIE